MVENNYDILKIHDGATEKEIRTAYRNLVLKFHTDKGGDDEQFKKIKRAYEDLKIGKKYPDTMKRKEEKMQNSIQVIQIQTSVEKYSFITRYIKRNE